jgi:hypothetical protein
MAESGNGSRSSVDVAAPPPAVAEQHTESLLRWIKCICFVTFDIELGQVGLPVGWPAVRV